MNGRLLELRLADVAGIVLGWWTPAQLAAATGAAPPGGWMTLWPLSDSPVFSACPHCGEPVHAGGLALRLQARGWPG